MANIGDLSDVILVTLILCTGMLYLRWKITKDAEVFERFLILLTISILYPYVIYKFNIGYGYSKTYELGAAIDTILSQIISRLSISIQNLNLVCYGSNNISNANNTVIYILMKIGLFTYITLMIVTTLAAGSVLKFFKVVYDIIRTKIR